jgi:lipoate-protein ligase A
VSRGSEAHAAGAPWRLILDGNDDGAWNMAVDEAILEAYDGAARKPAPTLRLYGWDPATLSLGRSQRAGGSYDPAALERHGLGLVRRPTGGGAVLHDRERTYAVVAGLGIPPFDGGVIATYRKIAGALRRALAGLGVDASAVEPDRRRPRAAPAACFELVGSWELVSKSRKVVGSAQARRRGAFLQHGSIPLRVDPARIAEALGIPVDASRFTDLETARGAPLAPGQVDDACVAAFEEAFGAPLVPGALTEGEALRAAELRCWKYDSVAWTRDGSIGRREARWGPALRR